MRDVGLLGYAMDSIRRTRWLVEEADSSAALRNDSQKSKGKSKSKSKSKSKGKGKGKSNDKSNDKSKGKGKSNDKSNSNGQYRGLSTAPRKRRAASVEMTIFLACRSVQLRS